MATSKSTGVVDETLYRSVLIAIAMRFESATQMERLIRWVRAIFGTTIAGQVAQHATIIADRFWSILGSDRVTPQVVQDSIYRLMIDARVTPRVATSIALAIKQLTLWYMNL